MAWALAALAALMLIVLIYGPGLLVAWTAGLRSLAALALSPAITMAIAGVSAMVARFANVRWSVLPLIAATVASVAAAWLISRRWPIVAPRQLPTWSRKEWRNVVLTAAGAVGAILVPALVAIRKPSAILQKWDGLFHLNLVEFIRQTGDGSTLDAGAIANTVSRSYYPAAWHDVVALLPPVVPSTIAVTAGAAVTAVVVWIVSLVYLARIVFPSEPLYAQLFAVLGAVYQASPVSLWSSVAHLPNALGNSLLPALLAWTVQLARVVKIQSTGRGTRLLVLGVALTGAIFAHPNTLFSYLALALPVFGFIVVTLTRRLWSTHRRLLALVGLTGLGAVVVAGAYVIFARPEVQSVLAFEQTARSSTLGAMITGLIDTTGAWTWGPNLAVAILVVVGLVVTIRAKTRRWLIVSFAIVWFLYVAAAGTMMWLRILTGLWYSDVSRLAPLISVVGIPLAATGAVWLACHAQFWWRRPAPLVQQALGARWKMLAGVSAVLLVVVVVDGAVQLVSRYQSFVTAYPSQYDERRPLFLDPDEEAMIERLDGELASVEAVLGDPFNGSAFLYGMIGQQVLFPHVNGVWDEDRRYLVDHFDEIDSDPKVCQIMRRLNVHYFYYDPERYGDALAYPGLDYGIDTDGLRLIDTTGKTSIYEITACR